MRVEVKRKAVSRSWSRTEDDLLIGDYLLKSKPGHHIVHENQDFHLRVSSSGTHMRAPSKRHERVRSRSLPLKPRWIKLVRFQEVLGILVRRMNRPECLKLSLEFNQGSS